MSNGEKAIFDNETCEFAARPFNRQDPGLCRAPATTVVYDGLLELDKDGNPWPFYLCEKHFAEMLKLAENDVCGCARGAPLFDSAGAEVYPPEGQENGISRKTRFSADAASMSDWAHKRSQNEWSSTYTFLSLQMRLAEAIKNVFAPRVWTFCLTLLLFATPFSEAQTSVPADTDDVADGGFSSSKTTRIADEKATSPVGKPAILSGAKSSAPAVEQSDASQSSSRSFFQDVVRHPPKTTEDKFHWGPALLQAANMTLFAHAWRAAWDPSLRYSLAHKPFFHDWFASYSGYDMSRWNDGDDFIVNDVGHPLGGAALGRVYLQNDDASWVQISKTRKYWGSRMKALVWMAAWSTQFEIGPLSETAFGNQGGWSYVNGCGTALSCLEHGQPTNNTGWTDFIMTPVVGLLWILGEDTADRYIVTPIARHHHILGRGILGTALEPSRSFASMFAGHAPWHLPNPENNFTYNAKPRPPTREDPNRAPLKRYELGAGYTNVSLPVLKSECGVCRQNNSGFGSNFTFNFNRVIGIDNTFSLLPAQGGSRGMVEGLFGVRVGERFEHWGIFGKVRPGFIYYQEAIPGLGGGDQATSLTRFAWDFGGIVEVYPNRRSSLRFDIGTTMVRYLSDHPDPRMSQLGDLRSSQYYVNQGNFQIATSYTYRF